VILAEIIYSKIEFICHCTYFSDKNPKRKKDAGIFPIKSIGSGGIGGQIKGDHLYISKLRTYTSNH
jgi:hypothetical protein